VTYPDEAVHRAITDHFEPVQINTQDGTPETAEVVAKFHQVWTPDLRILDAHGVELYRWNGYLPPSEYVAQLLAGRAHALLRSGDDAAAAEAYQDVLRRFPTSFVAAEAGYFAAVAAYRGSGEAPDLIDNWQQLQRRHPASVWRTKQSFIE
jgi:TolA-binding protein